MCFWSVMSNSVVQLAVRTLTILYATETGNACELAERAAAIAAEFGLPALLVDMATYNEYHLGREQDLLVIASTHGEGDPPFTAQDFFEYLDAADVDLSNVRFAVLALGDSGYERFCEAGKRLDRRLLELGATRLSTRLDVDVEGIKRARQWLAAVVGLFVEVHTA